MNKFAKSYMSNLKQVQGLGNNKSCTDHWKWQRISALALVFLYSWFIYLIMRFFDNPEYVVNNLLYSPFSLILFVILINVSIYHGCLGFKVICEDYIHNEFAKNSILLASYFVSFFTICTVSFALIINFIINI